MFFRSKIKKNDRKSRIEIVPSMIHPEKNFAAIEITQTDREGALWTGGIASCVAIGLICYEEDRIKKIGLYHSISQHSLDYLQRNVRHLKFLSPLDECFFNAIVNFLKDVKEINQVKVIITPGLEHQSAYAYETQYQLVKNAIELCFSYVNNNLKLANEDKIDRLPEKNVLLHQSASTFYLTTTGRHGILEDNNIDIIDFIFPKQQKNNCCSLL